jgi:hypothetical protein
MDETAIRYLIIVQSSINVIMLIALFLVNNRLIRHQKALKWFANHVRVDPKSQSEPIPENLAILIEKITDDQGDK